jgi:glycine hydroxymethyltransferase
MNAKLMANILQERDIKVSTGGTDSHIVLIHTGKHTGKDIANRLQSEHNIIVNKNTVPNDPRSVVETSGIRIGTAAMTTKKGRDVKYFESIANTIADVIGL